MERVIRNEIKRASVILRFVWGFCERNNDPPDDSQARRAARDASHRCGTDRLSARGREEIRGSALCTVFPEILTHDTLLFT